MNPLVSICTPSYNGARFLGETIRSVLDQTYPDFELIVVDDASSDGTAEVVAGYGDPRIRFERNAHNLGPEGNWNRCLELAGGRYYKLLPQDDLLDRTALADQVGVLEADGAKEIALVFGWRTVIDHAGRAYFNRGLARQAEGRIAASDLVRRCVRAGSNVIGEPGAGLIRRALVERVGRYDARNPYLIDLDWWFRVLRHGDGYYTNRRSTSFRVSHGSWSVALGTKQYRDFKGFVDKFATDETMGISPNDRRIGFARARINMAGRALMYRTVLRNAA